MRKITLYITHPKLIWYDFIWKMKSIRFKFITWLKLLIYKYEYKKYFNEYINAWKTDKMVKLTNFNPVLTVQRAIETVYSGTRIYPNYLALQIRAIAVETQEDTNKVSLYLRNPGILIGKGGKDIDRLTDLLTKLFNKPTTISITEMKHDINDWKMEDYE